MSSCPTPKPSTSPAATCLFARDALLQIGGFDPRYRAAGDDVDACWRVQEEVGKIGFSPAAVVWHHRRSSLQLYWQQQQGYGKAEALLAEKYPERYNMAGHIAWSGRIYGRGLTEALKLFPQRVYQGTWGSAPFQSLYERDATTFASLALMPEWYLLAGVLAVLSVLGAFWSPLLIALPLLFIAVAMPLGQAVKSAANAPFASLGDPPDRRQRTQTAWAHSDFTPSATRRAAYRTPAARLDAVAAVCARAGVSENANPHRLARGVVRPERMVAALRKRARVPLRSNPTRSYPTHSNPTWRRLRPLGLSGARRRFGRRPHPHGD